MCPSRTASASACSSMIPPRATLMSRAPCFIRASSAAPTTPRVLSLSGTWTLRKSDCASRVSKSTSSAPACSARSGGHQRVVGDDPHLEPLGGDPGHLEADLAEPRAAPASCSRSSVPMNAFRSHRPACIEASAGAMLRARASIIPTVCSAAAMVLPVGALSTSTPCRVAASRSMLSTPDPGSSDHPQALCRLEHLGSDLGLAARPPARRRRRSAASAPRGRGRSRPRPRRRRGAAPPHRPRSGRRPGCARLER